MKPLGFQLIGSVVCSITPIGISGLDNGTAPRVTQSKHTHLLSDLAAGRPTARIPCRPPTYADSSEYGTRVLSL